MRKAALALLLWSIAATLAAQQPAPFALQRLELDLTVDYEAERLDGTARMTVKNVSAAPASSVPLLLGRLMRVTGANGAGVTQDVVLFEDDSKRQVDFATVALPKPLAPGESTTISVTYGGHVVGYTETGSLYIKDHIAEDFTMIRSDAYAFPSIGVPSMKSNKAARRDEFTFDVRVTVPAGAVVAAGGTLVGMQDRDGRTTYHFASAAPAPFLNIAIAKYKTLDRNGVRIYYLPAEEAGAAMVMERTQKALDLYEAWFGPLPAPPRFTILEIPDDYGPQASLVAGILLEARVFRDAYYLYSLYHEVGHFWNVPDHDVPSPRWNEGLSTWFQEIVPEAIDGKPDSAFLKWMASNAVKRLGRDERLKRVPLRDYGKELMTDSSYSVGYLYLHVLEKKIGRPAVLATLRDYFQRHKSGGGTLREFIALLEKRHPETRAINADWIETTAWAAKLAQAASIDDLAATY